MVGQKIRHYEVTELLGRGGMGVVYKAIDTRLSRPVALKVLKEEIAENPDLKKRFLREARSASQISHPAVAQVFDVDEVDGLLYMALEFVEGQTVRKLIANREIDLLGAVEIAIQVADGLAQAHSRQIVHRDIKSDNIMVTPEGRVKILDFGLAKLMDPGASGMGSASSIETMAATQVGTVLGTVAYMSPEQARAKEIDHRTDIFSLGVVLYEMVIGDLPFRGESALDTMHAIAFEEVRPVTVVRRDVPPDVQRVVSRCLRKRPEDRYQTAEALLQDLEELKEALETGSQRAVTFRERVDRAKDWVRYSLPIGVSGGAVLLIVLALLGYLIFTQVEVGSLVLLLLIGLPVYRYIRNRRARMIQRFVSRASKMPEVVAVTVSGNRLTVVLAEAKAHHVLRINSLLDTLNRKLFYGEPLEAAIRTDLEEGEFQSLLREPGIRYLKESQRDDKLLPS